MIDLGLLRDSHSGSVKGHAHQSLNNSFSLTEEFQCMKFAEESKNARGRLEACNCFCFSSRDFNLVL